LLTAIVYNPGTTIGTPEVTGIGFLLAYTVNSPPLIKSNKNQ
jgi:hypothetical protein